MMKTILSLACVAYVAQPTSALSNLFGDDNDGEDVLGLGNLFGGGTDNDGDDVLDFTSLLSMFDDSSSWLDDIFDNNFDFTAIESIVDLAIADASDGVKLFGNAFETMFESAAGIPEQYAFFLKDLDIDVEAIANEVFSSDAIKDIPDDVAAAFESGADSAEDMMAMMLNVPSMANALKTAGVNIDLFAASAEIAELFDLTESDKFFSAIDFGTVDVKGVQKVIGAMDKASQDTFALAMAAAKDGTAVAVGAAWDAVLDDKLLSAQLTTQGLDVTALSAAASASTKAAAPEVIEAGSGAGSLTASAAVVVASIAALTM